MPKTIAEMMGVEWYEKLKDTLHSPIMVGLGLKLEGRKITPLWKDVFRAYELTPPSRVKVLIIGQDPYPRPGVAHGLAFSSGDGSLPYSLKNIFEDLRLCDYDHRTRGIPNLEDWAAQGVMLLNTCLTTQPGKPFAHKGWGWEHLTTNTVRVIDMERRPLVIMAWGKHAQTLVDETIVPNRDREMLVLRAAHPANERYEKGSFIGSQHFRIANLWLESKGVEPIKWI